MSNKRRKTIGQRKLRQNLAVRIRRGAEKARIPGPGMSRVYSHHLLSADYWRHGERLRNDAQEMTSAHWGGAEPPLRYVGGRAIHGREPWMDEPPISN